MTPSSKAPFQGAYDFMLMYAKGSKEYAAEEKKLIDDTAIAMGTTLEIKVPSNYQPFDYVGVCNFFNLWKNNDIVGSIGQIRNKLLPLLKKDLPSMTSNHERIAVLCMVSHHYFIIFFVSVRLSKLYFMLISLVRCIRTKG